MKSSKSKALDGKGGRVGHHMTPKELRGMAGKKDTRASLEAILHTRPGYYKEDVARGGKHYRKP